MQKIFTQVGSSLILSWFVFFVASGTLSIMGASVLKSRDTLLEIGPILEQMSRDIAQIKNLSTTVSVHDYRLGEAEKHINSCEDDINRHYKKLNLTRINP